MRMTSCMAVNAGYDDMGNAPALVAPCDRMEIEAGTWRRADQNAICTCGSAYYLHPEVQGALWLRRACDGLVKL